MVYNPGVDDEYIYGLTDPSLEGEDLYKLIRQYVIDKGLAKGIEMEADVDHRILEAFYKTIEKLSGFPTILFDVECVWDPESKKNGCVVVFARDKAPEDKELIDKMKLAIAAIKKELNIEGKAKWYIGENEEYDELSFPETGDFNTPPCFT